MSIVKGRYEVFLRSRAWHCFRRFMFALRRRRCERCGSNWHLRLHHKHYDLPWGQETDNDVEVLCDHCHRAEHGLMPHKPQTKKKKHKLLADKAGYRQRMHDEAKARIAIAKLL